MGLPNPFRETKFSGTSADREIFIFPIQLTTCRTGRLTQLIHTLAICVTISSSGVFFLRMSEYLILSYLILSCLLLSRSLLSMSTTYPSSWCGKREAYKKCFVVTPEKAASVTGTTLRTTGPVPADSRQ